jgi:hypothetical protein
MTKEEVNKITKRILNEVTKNPLNIHNLDNFVSNTDFNYQAIYEVICLLISENILKENDCRFCSDKDKLQLKQHHHATSRMQTIACSV